MRRLPWVQLNARLWSRPPCQEWNPKRPWEDKVSAYLYFSDLWQLVKSGVFISTTAGGEGVGESQPNAEI